MIEKWEFIYGLDHYQISSIGRVRNVATDRILRTPKNVHGARTVTLRHDGESYGLSVKLLVARAFLPRVHWYEQDEDAFDSVIQRDWDQDNCRVENLMWRPRWFVWHYTHQYHRVEDPTYQVPVVNVDTNASYHTIVGAAMIEGLLMRDVYNSAGMGESIFPTGHSFVWA